MWKYVDLNPGRFYPGARVWLRASSCIMHGSIIRWHGTINGIIFWEVEWDRESAALLVGDGRFTNGLITAEAEDSLHYPYEDY